MAVSPKTKRRRLQISLRTLMLFVAFASFPLAYLGWQMHQARQQRAMIDSLRALNGTVKVEVSGPTCARSLLGDDLFTQVISIEATGHVTDDMLAPISRCSRLEGLVLVQAAITDATLRHVRGLTRLYGIVLNKTQITDAGLANVAGLTNVKSLGLDGTQITDEGLVHLRGLGNLRAISLNDTKVTDAGILQLCELPKLGSLRLKNTQITDDGIAILCKLPELKTLDIVGTKRTKVGLVHLRNAPQLKRLFISGGFIDDPGVAELRAAKPGLEIQQRRPPQSWKGDNKGVGCIKLELLPTLGGLNNSHRKEGKYSRPSRPL